MTEESPGGGLRSRLLSWDTATELACLFAVFYPIILLAETLGYLSAPSYTYFFIEAAVAAAVAAVIVYTLLIGFFVLSMWLLIRSVQSTMEEVANEITESE